MRRATAASEAVAAGAAPSAPLPWRRYAAIALAIGLAGVLYLAIRPGPPPPAPAEPSVPSPSPPTAPGSEAGTVAATAPDGQALFNVTCPACHGRDAKGVPGLGKDMTTSEFIASRSDAEMVEFIKRGRPVDDPLNTTGVMMPPKGANMALSDDDLLAVVQYMRSLSN